MDGKVRTVEQVIAELASRSWGVVTRLELLAAGITPMEINHRLATGALLAVHRGVYRAGHRAPSTEASYLAAVKACGDGALLCGHANAYLLALTKPRLVPLAEVVAPTERRVRGVRTRRSRCSLEPDAWSYRGIPVTTVARTVVDLAASLSLDDLARACHEAGVKHHTTPAQVAAVLERRPNAPGARKIKEVMWGDGHVTLSRMEKRFLQLLREAGLPLPANNKTAGTKRVDCRWSDPPLTVELDSYRYHNSRYSWEQDHRRRREARARGDDFRRYTWGDVFEDSAEMLDELRKVLRPS